MNNFGPAVGRTQHVLHIGDDGIQVHTGDSRVVINGDGLLVEHSAPPSPPVPPLPHERLALGSLILTILVVLAVLMLFSGRARKVAGALVLLIVIGAGVMWTTVDATIRPARPVVTDASLGHLGLVGSIDEAHAPIPSSPTIAPVVAGDNVEHSAGTTAGSYTLYAGGSPHGVSLSAPPPWTSETTGSWNGQTYTSGRFATVEQAERQLWSEVQQSARELLTRDYPKAHGWTPPVELLQRGGVVVERCVEQTQLAVGGFTEPMYIVHWRVAMSDATRDLLARAWTPVVTRDRILTVVMGAGALTGLFALLNLLLRGITGGVWQWITGRKAAAAAVTAGILIVGLLLG